MVKFEDDFESYTSNLPASDWVNEADGVHPNVIPKQVESEIFGV